MTDQAVRDLLAREEIRDVVLRYGRGIDRCDAELITSCYHPDAIDDHGDFIGSPEEFAEHVTGERSGRHESTTHLLAAPAIRLDGDVAHVDTYGLAHHLTVPDEDGHRRFTVMAVRYLDRFELRDDAWRIAHRRCVFDWRYTLDLDGDATGGWSDRVVRGSSDRNDPWYAFLAPSGQVPA